MKSGAKEVFVVIPAYNEGQVIKSVVKYALKSFKKDKNHKYSIVVVDDGSTDDTATEAKAGGAIVIQHIMNSGAGAATSTGLEYARKNSADIMATMDADGQHSPIDVINGVNLIEADKIDLLIGSRLIDSEGMSKVKVVGNKGLSFITYLIFGVKSSDSQSGLRIYSRKAIDSIFWKSSGYEFCSEMLWRANQLKLTYGEYPIEAIYTEYSKSKGQNNWNALNIIRNLFSRRVSEFLR